MEPDATEVNKAAEVLHAMAVEDLSRAREQLGMQYRLTGGDSPSPDLMNTYHNAPIEVVPNPNTQAVQLLRELMNEHPWSPDDEHSLCIFCNQEHWAHAPDCSFGKAKAFIDALDVK